ncbi:MAG: 2Fe-2S iron-sulfur cluster-binding protein [Gammaproteobacteria bacterium]
MPWNTVLAPSGRAFTVNAGETVLKAARRQGLHLSHDCGSGSCGACRARLISGHVHYPDGSPLALTALEVQRGEVLLCRAVPLDELALDAQEITASADLTIKTLPCRVMRMQRLNHDVEALYLKLPAVERLAFLPGNYIDVLLPDGHRRSFSLANPPHDDGLLELHVRQVPGGRFTTEVFQKLSKGALLQIQGPLGTFFLREDEIARPILMVAGGAGFAPFKAILRHIFECGPSRRIELYWGACAQRDLYADALVTGWRQSQPQFKYVPVLSESLSSDHWRGRTGFVHAAILAEHADLSGYDIYISGPPSMIEAARQTFPMQGADPRRMFSDPFDYAPEVRAAFEKRDVTA